VPAAKGRSSQGSAARGEMSAQVAPLVRARPGPGGGTIVEAAPGRGLRIGDTPSFLHLARQVGAVEPVVAHQYALAATLPAGVAPAPLVALARTLVGA